MSKLTAPHVPVVDPKDPANEELVAVLASVLASPRRGEFPLERYLEILPSGLLRIKAPPEMFLRDACRFLAGGGGVTRRDFLFTSAALGAGAVLFARDVRAQLVPGGFWKTRANTYQTPYSLRCRPSAPTYMQRTFGTPSNQHIYTLSLWVKRSALSASGYWDFLVPWVNGNIWHIDHQIYQDKFGYEWGQANISGNLPQESAVRRDVSAWYHVVWAVDLTQATAANRLKLYVNGVQQPLSGAQPSQNYSNVMNTAVNHTLFTQYSGTYATSSCVDGYIADVNFVDGLQLSASAFGMAAPNNPANWIPIKPVVPDYGKNGFRLEFGDNSTVASLGLDTAPLGGSHTAANNWAPSGFQTYDQVLDSPTNNFATWNPLWNSSSKVPTSAGNLNTVPAGSAAWLTTASSMAVPSTAFWYAEFCMVSHGSAQNNDLIGLVPATLSGLANNNLSSASTIGMYTDFGSVYVNNSVAVTLSAAAVAGDVLMMALGNGKLWYGKNGVWLGSGSPNPATATAPNVSGLSGDYCFGLSSYTPPYGSPWLANFGQGGQAGLTYNAAAGGAFKYPPPSGFKALSTANLPAPAIVNPSQFFAASIYTGTGVAGAGPALGFQPDFAWFKNRGAAVSHSIFDSVRGPGKRLLTNSTAVEDTMADALTGFTGSGFTLGADALVPNAVNGAANNYVSWAWKKGAAPGFDAVGFASGAAGDKAIAHGLGAVPRFIITKSRDSAAGSWAVYHGLATSNLQFLRLQTTDAVVSAGSNIWGTGHTASTFGITSGNGVIADTNCIAYLWAEVAGFSKFGAYMGNGSADGPFVWCGFRPRFLLVKRSDAGAEGWVLLDTARSSSNPDGTYVYANNSLAEYSNITLYFDFTASGFKCRTSNDWTNISGATYVFAAFAESPFKYANAR